jgi:hypothetical protein
MLINLLCGVQKPRHVVLQHLPNSTPHNYRRHITHPVLHESGSLAAA